MFRVSTSRVTCSVVAAAAVSGLLPVLASNAAAQSQSEKSAEPVTYSWYRGNTHTHTLNSGGADTLPIDVARWYREHGYQFLVITDHDYATDVVPINAAVGAPEKFLVIGGEEITQTVLDPAKEKSFHSAEIGAPLHVNSLFTSGLMLPIGIRKCDRSGMCSISSPADLPSREVYKRNLETVQAHGGIGQINHPNFFWTARPEDLVDVPDRVLIEIWNSVTNNLGGDDGEGHVSPSAEGFWDSMLSHGKIAWGVGSDDSHVFKEDVASQLPWRPEGNAWIMVRAAKLSLDDLKAAISSGNFYASNGVELSDITRDAKSVAISIKTEAATGPNRFTFLRYSTKFIGRNGEVLATVAGLTPRYQFSGHESYIRAVVTDSNGYHAWTQPVFVDRRRDCSPYAP